MKISTSGKVLNKFETRATKAGNKMDSIRIEALDGEKKDFIKVIIINKEVDHIGS